MKLNSLKNKLGGAILGISLLLGIGFASSVTTQAQYPNGQWSRQQQRQIERERLRRQREYEREQLRRQRQAQRAGYGNGGYNNGGYNNGGYGGYNDDNYSNYGGSYEFRQTALNAGYNEGRKAGMEDRSRGRGYNYANDSDYRSADKDYNSRYGNRALYQQYFRQAFINGYADGYRGY